MSIIESKIVDSCCDFEPIIVINFMIEKYVMIECASIAFELNLLFKMCLGGLIVGCEV